MGIPTLYLPPLPGSTPPVAKRWIEPVVCVSDFDESQIQLSDPAGADSSPAKAETVAAQFESALILGCDSLLLVNGEIYGKPDSPESAIARWQKMSGQVGALYTGHALIDLSHRRTSYAVR